MAVRTVFMGSDPIALDLLDELRLHQTARVELVGIFTQPDRRTGRGMQVRENEIKKWALRQSLPVLQPDRCGPQEEQWLRDQGVELILVMAYGQILRNSLLEIPRLGAWNWHASLLPAYRGASPIHTAVACGEVETGLSLMRMVTRLDAGPVAGTERVIIDGEEQTPEVITRLRAACVPLLRRHLDALCAGTLATEPQQEDLVTYCRPLTKDDAVLDFRASALDLHHRIRAFQPWPGALLPYENVPLKVGRARIVIKRPEAPGTLMVENGRVVVHTGEGALELLELQRPTGRMLPTEEFLRGFPLKSRTTLVSRPMPPLVSRTPFARKKAGPSALGH